MSDLEHQIREAGLTCSIEMANRALGISRGHGYSLARSGEYPVKVLKLGRAYRVVSADLLRLLALEGEVA